jgi:hypothetical protein
MKGHKTRTKLVKDKTDDLLADSNNILNRRENYFCQLLNVHGVINVRQIEMYTSEPLVPETSSFEDEITVEKLKTYKC